MGTIAGRLGDTGFVAVPGVLTADQCAEMVTALEGAGSGRAGSRNLLDVAACQRVAAEFKAHAQIGPLLRQDAVAVQCTFFDKSMDNNWLVAPHQDLSIPIQKRVPHPDCSGWSEKEGVLYVQPPVAVLESLVAVRAHLDDCGSANGPLRVIPGSHRYGRLPTEAARALREQQGTFECIARQGDVLLIRPLLVHSSSRAQAQAPRRVLHFLFGPKELPCGLKWHRTV